MSFFSELQRRNVVRVGIAYVIVAWVIAQVAEFAFENFGAPEWVLKTVVVLLLLGLPLALFFAWAFELTPDGVKREKDVDRSKSITRRTGRKLDLVIIGTLVIALGYFIWERQATNKIIDPTNESGVAASENTLADAPMQRSIAVLPFLNMSSDEEQEWFSDGLTEEILNALARTPDLLVAARTSSFKFKGSNDDIQTIAKALGVAHVLEGSVRRGGDRLRVTAQLIRANDGFHLWSQTYDRDPEDVIAIQENVAIEIATALETAMDPEALAAMVSSGTRSVPAYNAYLQGLAFGISTQSTGDAYEFLSARDAFQEAIDLDPEFGLAYWELAKFWRVQLTSTNIVSGIVEIPRDEMRARFDEAIAKAIEYERDPVNALRYRSSRAFEYNRFTQALRLNTEFLENRPNDQAAQNRQLILLGSVSKDEELLAAVVKYQESDGYDPFVTSNSITASLVSDDMDFIRNFAQQALQRHPDSTFIMYQAHRALLWAGDVDGGAALEGVLRSGNLPEDSRLLVALRQACAENNLSEGRRIYDRLQTEFSHEPSMVWLSNIVMNEIEKANEHLAPMDEEEGLGMLSDFLNYAHFDARRFPNLMALLESQGIVPREPREVPYRCKT